MTLADRIAVELRRRADPAKAPAMAAYMKTTMPFHGVQKPGRREVARAVRPLWRPASQAQYEATVRQVWALPHREEKYLAIELARMRPEFLTPASLPLYTRMVREGAWWDLVDETAIHLVGQVLLRHRAEISPTLDRWIDDSDLWLRRTALIAQITHREATDHRRLFRYCRRRASETEFFIRKAIGWALRDYSYAAPDRVLHFLEQHRDRLSGLSFREGARALRRAGEAI